MPEQCGLINKFKYVILYSDEWDKHLRDDPQIRKQDKDNILRAWGEKTEDEGALEGTFEHSAIKLQS